MKGLAAACKRVGLRRQDAGGRQFLLANATPCLCPGGVLWLNDLLGRDHLGPAEQTLEVPPTWTAIGAMGWSTRDAAAIVRKCQFVVCIRGLCVVG